MVVVFIVRVVVVVVVVVVCLVVFLVGFGSVCDNGSGCYCSTRLLFVLLSVLVLLLAVR